MAKKTLPPHLKNLANMLDQGRDLKGNKLSNVQRKNLAKTMGASFFKTKEGKIRKI